MARYLGIEVTESQVKGVVLRTAYRKLQIEAVHRALRPLAGLEGITHAVGEVLRSVGGVIDAAYAAFPGTEASLRIIELPKAVFKRGGRIVATELEGSLPFDVETAVVDAQVIQQGAQVELLAAAARSERIRQFIEAIRLGGIEPREVGVSSVALGDLAAEIPELAAPGPILLVHAYESCADMVVLADGIVRMARTLTAQTTPLARDRGIRSTIGAYLAGGGAAPTRAYLCGDAAAFEMDVVADALQLSADAVALGIPLGPIEVSPAVEPTQIQVAPLALALALRGLGRGDRIDLRQGDLAVTSSTQVFRERGWFLAGCAAAIMVSWGFTTTMRYISLAQERDRLQQTLGRVTMDVFGERITDARRAKSLALGTNSDAEQDPLPLADAYDAIGALSNAVPESVRSDITGLDVLDEHVQITGLVDSLADRDHIVDALSQYPCFQHVEPGRVQRNPGDNRQQFTLDLELRCPERQAPGRHGAAAGSTSGSHSTGGGTNAGSN